MRDTKFRTRLFLCFLAVIVMTLVLPGLYVRKNIKEGTPVGLKAKSYIDRGELVPDEVTCELVAARINEKDCENGFLLDGFPRNMEQARKLHEALDKAGMHLDYVVEILLPRQVAKNRIMGRRLCAVNNNHPNNIFIDAIKPEGDKCRVCGGALSARADDQNEEAINKRHDIYYNDVDGTLAAAHYFKKLAGQEPRMTYIELNGEGSIDSIRETLLSRLN